MARPRQRHTHNRDIAPQETEDESVIDHAAQPRTRLSSRRSRCHPPGDGDNSPANGPTESTTSAKSVLIAVPYDIRRMSRLIAAADLAMATDVLDVVNDLPSTQGSRRCARISSRRFVHAISDSARASVINMRRISAESPRFSHRREDAVCKIFLAWAEKVGAVAWAIQLDADWPGG